MANFTGLSPIKKSIATLLASVTAIKSVEWYNAQYEDGSLIDEVGAFVEFPDDIDFERASKEQRDADLRIRLHVYHKLLADVDNHISDAETDEHEAVALAALNLLDGARLLGANDVALTKPLRFVKYRHWHRYRSWLVTWIEFDCKLGRP